MCNFIIRYLDHLEPVDEEGSPDVLLDADDAALADDAGRRRARLHLADDVHASQDLRESIFWSVENFCKGRLT